MTHRAEWAQRAPPHPSTSPLGPSGAARSHAVQTSRPAGSSTGAKARRPGIWRVGAGASRCAARELLFRDRSSSTRAARLARHQQGRAPWPTPPPARKMRERAGPSRRTELRGAHRASGCIQRWQCRCVKNGAAIGTKSFG